MSNDNSVSVLTVNGTDFVTGLYWRALSAPRNFMREAREIGRKQGMDIVVLRQTTHKVFAGFVKAGAGVKKGQYSIATALASQLGDNWLGVFRTGDGQYLAAGVNAGAIIPQGDRLGDEAFAREFVRRMIGFFQTGSIQIYAPAEIGAPDAEPRELKDILNQSRYPKECQLRPLTFGLTRRELIVASAVAVTVIVGIIVLWKWRQAVAEAERQARLERERALAELKEQSGREADVRALEYPWVNAPDPIKALRRCVSLINDAPYEIEGWQFLRAGCNGDEVAFTYQRAPFTTVNQFVAGARALGYENPEVDESGEVGVASMSLDLPPYGDEALQDLQTMTSDLRSTYQTKGSVVSIDPLESSGYDEELISAGAIDWQSFEFEVRGDVLNAVTLGDFYQPGLRLVEILLDRSADGATWVLRGNQYVR